MPSSDKSSLVIVPNPLSPLSKDQTAFNALIKKIKRRREKLAIWQAVLPQVHQQVMDNLLPLQQTLADLQLELAIALDAAYMAKSTTKTEKRKIANLIVMSTEMVLAFRDDATAKSLYNLYAKTDFDEEEAEHMAEMTAILKESLGIDLNEMPPDFVDEHHSPKKSHRRDEGVAQSAPRKLSAREAAKAAQREAEEKQLSQSIRDVFRKLVSALHPDRERDLAEKERKTTLMKRVNEAYEKGNLLQLLELQLEVEQIDQDHMATVQPERLKHYIKIFREQLKDLEEELKGLEQDWALRLGLSPWVRFEPDHLLMMLQQDIAGIKMQTAETRMQLNEVGDPGRLKALLKQLKLQRRPVDDFDDFF